MSALLWSGIGGGAAGLAIGFVKLAYALLRSPERATSVKGSRLLITSSVLPADEVRHRLVDRMARSGFSVLNANLEDRVVLASGGYGFLFPVYLTAQPDGLTLIEVGAVPRGLPTFRSGLAKQQARCLQAIEQAVAPEPAWAADTSGEGVMPPSTPLLRRARKLPSRYPRRLAVVALTGAVLAGVGSVAAFRQANAPDSTLPYIASGSRVDHAISRLTQSMHADPAIRAKFKNLNSPRAVVDEGAALVNEGLKRVGVGTLERFARTSQTMLRRADDSTCAQYFLSSGSVRRLPQTLEKLTDAELNEYLSVRYALMVAAAHGDAVPAPLAKSQADAAAALLSRDLGHADSVLLGELGTGTHPDAQVCRIARKVFSSTIALRPHNQALLLRYIFQT